MREYKSYEKEIFRELYESKIVDVYHFFQKFGLSPGHIAKFILNCEEKGLVNYSNGELSISEHGKSYIEENKKKIYLDSRCGWKEIPENMKLGNQLTIDEILSLSNNDKRSFLEYLEMKGTD